MEPEDKSILMEVITSSMSEKKPKAIARHKGILKYLTEEWEIPSEEDAENDEYKSKIYKENSNTWNFLIISLTCINFGLVRQCGKNVHNPGMLSLTNMKSNTRKKKFERSYKQV